MVKLKNLNRTIYTYDGQPMMFKRSETEESPLNVKTMLCELLVARLWQRNASIGGKGNMPITIFGSVHGQSKAVRDIWSSSDTVELDGVLKEDIEKIVLQGCQPFVADQVLNALFEDEEKK